MLRRSPIVSQVLGNISPLRYYPRLPAKFPVNPRGNLRLPLTRIIDKRSSPWIWRVLLRIQRLLIRGESEKASSMHLHWLEVMKPGERERQDFDERAVNLFTRAGDFSSAIKVVNRMMEDGITIKPNVCMLLLRRMRTQDPRHIKQVVELFQSETVQLDDLAFNALLDSMAYLKDSAHDIEAAFLVYKKSRGEGWITPASMYGTLIQSFCAADKYRRAFRYLQEYRRVTRVEPQLQPLDLSEANVLSGDGDTEASVAQEEEVYDDERFQKYARIQGGASARPDKQELWNQKLRFRYGTPSPNGLVCYPYTAIAYGLSKSLDPMPRRVRGLFLLMREDGITPDAEMCNILISTFFRWGWPHRALAIFESMCRPSKYPLPNASTFRKMFIGLNPLSRGRKKPVEGITARQLFCEMLKVDSLNASRSFSQSGPRAKNNIISTATYNAALGTFVTSGDFAAAWALLSYYSIHHVSPDKGTTKHVTLPLLRRMQLETLHGPLDELMWTDRLLGIRRAEFNTQERRVLLADRLYHLAHMEFGQSLESPEDFPTLIKRSPRLYKGERQELVFLAALLRAALRAQLGYTPQDDPKLVKRAIEIAYQRVMSEMAPFGRIVGLGKNLRHHRKIMLRGRQSIVDPLYGDTDSLTVSALELGGLPTQPLEDSGGREVESQRGPSPRVHDLPKDPEINSEDSVSHNYEETYEEVEDVLITRFSFS